MVLLPAAFSAFLAAVLSYLINYHGVFFTPDSFQYWESSISLVEGYGYQNFHRPVNYWPPLFSLYLAGVQYVFGVSGFSLVLSVIFVTVGTAFSWTWFFCSICGSENKWVRFALAISFASMASFHFAVLWSDQLSVFLIGIFLIAGLRAIKNPGLFSCFLFSLSVCALLLVRHANITFIPGIWVAAFFFFKGSAPWRLLFAVLSLTTLPPLLVYWAVRSSLDLGSAYSIVFGEHTTQIFLLLTNFFLSIGNLFLPPYSEAHVFKTSFASGVAVFCGVLYALFFRFRMRDGLPGIKVLKALAVLFAVQTAGLFGILSTFFAEGRGGLWLEERYVWHISFALMGTLAVLLTNFSRSGLRSQRFSSTSFITSLFVVLCTWQLAAASAYGVSNSLADYVNANILFFHGKSPPESDTKKVLEREQGKSKMHRSTIVLLGGAWRWSWHIPKNHTMRRSYYGLPPAYLPNGMVIRSPGGPNWYYWKRDANGVLRPPPGSLPWTMHWKLWHRYMKTKGMEGAF